MTVAFMYIFSISDSVIMPYPTVQEMFYMAITSAFKGLMSFPGPSYLVELLLSLLLNTGVESFET